jgi:hypothetical protein
MHTLKHVTSAGSIAVLVLATAPAIAATASVTNDNNSGAGSFRAAVRVANANPSINLIRFRGNLGTINLESTATYTGGQDLAIHGSGTEISSAVPQTFDLFVASGGGNLTLKDITFQDGDSGVVVEVPGDAEGEISVSLLGVTITDNLRFGLEIDENDPAPGEPFAASIGLSVAFSRFARNGLLDTDDEDEGDVDAVRVNERGDGDITATVIHSTFTDNGADGFELDEEGLGDATMTALHSSFDDNGTHRVGGDDGLDIDESEDGGIWLNVVGSTFNGSTDDGIGLDESDDETGTGDLHLTLVNVEASSNTDSGISVDEGGPGNFEAKFVLVSAEENDDKGADMTEADDGNFDGRAVNSSFSLNADDGIAVEQVAPGVGALLLVNVALDDNGNEPPVDADGVTVTQVGPGS